MTLSLILADDHPIFRDGLISSIEETGEFKVLGVGASADESVTLAEIHHPDIALLDLSMPGSGISAAARINDAKSAKCIVMLTASEESEDVSSALQAGAKGYILKGISAIDLRSVLTRIANGEGHVSPGLAANMLMKMQPPKPVPPQPIDALTKREEMILKGVANGLSNREIGVQLHIQEKTVKHYMTLILSKLNLRNRTEAALLAQKTWGRS